MLLIRKHAYARAGLIGNPSDGYHGKTLSLLVRNYRAEATLYEWDQIEVVFSHDDRSRFDSVGELVRDVRLHGYYGGIRLVKATIKKFVEYCWREGHQLHSKNFSVRYQSDVPRQVGLAGSSAIIVATLRCLMEFYGVEIPRQVQPSLALSVETDELGIAAGPQDRVVQTYEGLVYMDFARERMREHCGFQCGIYEPLDPALLPPLYVAHKTDVSAPTEIVHSNLRARFEQGEPAVVEAMDRLAELAVQAREAILAGDAQRLGQLIDANFELRRSICRLPAGQVEMVECARRAGATAKFAGSGGAIVGTYPDDATFRQLEADLDAIGCRVIRPVIEESL
ncbi:MAG: mevalonate kinase family protein [Planctomycetota bacterium]|jgi:glucuronokinase